MSERINTRVVLHLEGLTARFVLSHQSFLAFFGICVHTAELVHGEQLAVTSHTNLLKDDGTLGVANLHCQCAEQKQGRAKNDGNACADHVHDTLDHMAIANLVRMLPDVVQVQTLETEEASVSAVEFVQLVLLFQGVLFGEAAVDVGLENGTLGLDSQRLDETCVVQLVEHFLADGFKLGQVGIQEDDADTATIVQISKYVDETQVGEHGEKTDTPCLANGFVVTGPAENIVLVGINLDEQEWLAGAVGSQKFLVEPRPEKAGRIDNILELLLVEQVVDSRI